MFMRTQHDCKTTFAGPNPFIAAEHLMPRYLPPVAAAGKPCTTQQDVLDLLRDGIPRTIPDMLKLTGISQPSMSRMFKKLVAAGYVMSRPRKQKGIRAIPEFWREIG